MKYAVDRIENGIVILENIKTKDRIEIKLNKLPFEISDGDILKFDGKNYVKDNEEYKSRQQIIREKMNRLKKGERTMYLVLIRHGESVWNKENRFTGWTDVELSEKGKEEAIEAGKILTDKNLSFKIAYTSVLKRAINTLDLILENSNINLEVKKDYRLNERHYGSLQGLNKDEMRAKYGEKQVHIWRRSYDVRPPEITVSDERYPGNDPMYKNIPKNLLPLTESLKDTLVRVRNFYEEEAKPHLLNGENVLIVAHGNSLRALIKDLENISDDEITQLEIPTGKPIIYKLDSNLNILSKEWC